MTMAGSLIESLVVSWSVIMYRCCQRETCHCMHASPISLLSLLTLLSSYHLNHTSSPQGRCPILFESLLTSQYLHHSSTGSRVLPLHSGPSVSLSAPRSTYSKCPATQLPRGEQTPANKESQPRADQACTHRSSSRVLRFWFLHLSLRCLPRACSLLCRFSLALPLQAQQQQQQQRQKK